MKKQLRSGGRRGPSTTQYFINEAGKKKNQRKPNKPKPNPQNPKWNVLMHPEIFKSVCCKLDVKLQLAIGEALGCHGKSWAVDLTARVEANAQKMKSFVKGIHCFPTSVQH